MFSGDNGLCRAGFNRVGKSALKRKCTVLALFIHCQKPHLDFFGFSRVFFHDAFHSFPSAILSKLQIAAATFSFSGRNLWYLAPNLPKYTKFDPDINSLVSGNAQ